MIDFKEEINRQQKKLEKILNEKRSMEGRMNNPKFVQNAKPELVEQTKSRIAELQVQENAISELIKSLSN